MFLLEYSVFNDSRTLVHQANIHFKQCQSGNIGQLHGNNQITWLDAITWLVAITWLSRDHVTVERVVQEGSEIGRYVYLERGYYLQD